MLLLNWKTAIAPALCAVTCSLPGLAQVAPPVILRIEYENGVRGCGFHAGQTPRDLLQQAVDLLPVRGRRDGKDGD